MGMETNTLYYGDCLDWMRQWDDGCVDLIYLDPPFNSNTDYNILYAAGGAGQAQYRAFADTWRWDEAAADRYARYEAAVGRRAHRAVIGLHHLLGPSGMMAYLTYMAERLEEMHRLLKPTGSIYLHCDPTASHYLKVVMDGVFGAGNFRNEITWKRTGSHGGSKRWGPIHDTLLFFSKSDTYQWNRSFQDYEDSYVDDHYRHEDERGRFQLVSLTGAGTRAGDSGESWRGINPTDVGRHWAVPLGSIQRAVPSADLAGLSTQEKLDLLDAAGLVYWPERGAVPRQKRYLDEGEGVPIQDTITDINPIGAQAKERLGYPTQKPLALLERIIRASSNEGDVVLDPFCGCGTAIEAADRLNRRWVGVDISSFAIDLIIERRLRDKTTPTRGIPQDMDAARKLAAEQPFSFESWAVTRLPGFAPNMRQVADGGVDGRATLAVTPDDAASRLALAQVKGGRFALSALRDFLHVVEGEKAALGCYVTLEPVGSQDARAAAANAGTVRVSGLEYRRMQLWSIGDYFAGRMPQLPMMTDPYTGKALVGSRLF